MVLSTSFSLEELEYLAGLPDEVYPQGDIAAARVAANRAWTTPDRRGSKWGEWCSHQLHGHAHEGTLYYRHGEMIAKLPADDPFRYMTSDEVTELKTWLDSIHAHELATAQ